MKIENSEPLGKEKLKELYAASLVLTNEEDNVPPQIIWVDDSAVATLGNFSASTGKAKSKKTFNVSALVAASLSQMPKC